MVIDTSGSTQEPSGFDLDGDGETGINPQTDPWTGMRKTGAGSRQKVRLARKNAAGSRNTDLDDSILMAEVLAACEWASLQLARASLVGIASFAGKGDPDTGEADYSEPAAREVVELTDDASKIQASFREILMLGSSGGTDYSAAITKATQMLSSTEVDGNRRKILFVTDGAPTLPVGSMAVSDDGDRDAALAAARMAKRGGIEIHVILIGVKQKWGTDAATGIASLTGGTVSQSRTGADLTDLMSAAMAIP